AARSMTLVQYDSVIQEVSSAAFHSTLHNTVCRGLSREVRTGWILRDRTAAETLIPYLRSRLKIRKWGADSKGNSSRNCWTMQRLFGCLRRLRCRTPPIMAADET